MSEPTKAQADAAIQTAEDLAEAINWLATVPDECRERLADIIRGDIGSWKLFVVHKSGRPSSIVMT